VLRALEDGSQCQSTIVDLSQMGTSGLPVKWLHGITAKVRACDAVVGWTYRGALAATTLAIPFNGRPKLLWSVRHGLDAYEDEAWKTKAITSLLAHLSRAPDLLIFNSERTRQQHSALGFDIRRSRLVPNGTTCPRVVGAEERKSFRTELGVRGRFAVGMLARDHVDKGHDRFRQLASIFSSATESSNGYSCQASFLAGCDSDEQPLGSRIESIGGVNYSRGRLRVPKRCFFGSLDLFCLPSRRDAFPNVVLEALAYGVPVAAFDVGAVSEILRVGGVVVRPGDMEAMIGALSKFRSGGTRYCRRVGARGRRHVERNYTVEQMVRTFDQVVLSVAG